MSNTIETNKAKSDVFNMDCVEYMRTLPDNFFDIAICDPPYGDTDSGDFQFGENTSTSNRLRFHGGDRWERYYKEEDGDLKNIDWDVAPQQEFFDELFRVSKNQVIWGGGIIFAFHLQDAFSYGENYLFQRSSPWQCVNMRGHHSKVMQNYLSQFHNVESIAENSIQRRNR